VEIAGKQVPTWVLIVGGIVVLVGVWLALHAGGGGAAGTPAVPTTSAGGAASGQDLQDMSAALQAAIAAEQAAIVGAITTGTTTQPPAGTTPAPSGNVAVINVSQIPGTLATIWNTYGFEETSNSAAYASGWVNQLSSLLNVPTGVATAAWNAIQANPGNYVKQLGNLTDAQANQNFTDLLNSLLTQFNATPTAFNNLPIAPLNLTKTPAPAAPAPSPTPTPIGNPTISNNPITSNPQPITLQVS
jgi:hypothetical protein